MRTLNKTLCLVLALVMVLGMFGVATATEFTDDETIQYKEAVGVMTGIGAINGMGDGTFAPTGNVTRAQAAKMVAYAVLGADIAETLPVVASSFKDVDANFAWAIPSIEYLVGEGVINGRGDGTFDPNGNVTAYEIAKMLLVAAGYGKNGEFVGSSWALNVAKIAQKSDVKLFAGTKATELSAAATREECALYCFNGLTNVDMVKYSKNTEAYEMVSPVATIAQATYGMKTVTGVVTGAAATGVKGTAVAAATLTAGKVTALAAPVTYKAESDMSLIGQVANLYYKDANTVYYIEQASTAINVATAVTDKAGFTKAFGAGTNDAAAVYNFTANYAAATSAAALTGFIQGTTAAPGTYALFAGELVSFVAPAASSFDKVIAISTTAGSESITFSAAGLKDNSATSGDVVNEYKDIAVGDYVQITAVGTLFNVEKAPTVEGKITEVGAGNAYVVLNGTKYETTKVATDNSGLSDAFPTEATDYANNTYKLYLDNTGKFFACTAVVAAPTSNVVYVTSITPFATVGEYGLVYAYQAIDSTGATITYKVAGAKDTDVTNIGFYKVTLNAQGVADFSAYTPVTDCVDVTVDTAISKADVLNGTKYYYASDVEFIFVTGTGATLKVTKATGLAAADGNTLTGALLYFNNTTNVNKVVSTVIVPAAFVDPSIAGSDLVYLPKTIAHSAVNASGYVYNVYVDGVKTAVTSKDTNPATLTTSAGGFATYTVSPTGVYTFSSLTAASATVKYDQAVAKNGIFNNYISGINATNAVVVDLVNTAPGATAITSVGAMEALTATKTFTIDYVLNAAGAITQIYITAIA